MVDALRALPVPPALLVIVFLLLVTLVLVRARAAAAVRAGADRRARRAPPRPVPNAARPLPHDPAEALAALRAEASRHG